MTKASAGMNNEYKKGLWTEEEDKILIEYIRVHGRRHWNRIPKLTGLMRNGKSCRLRWLNYLSPNVKHGSFSEEEDDLIIRLHNLLGNRWSLIAGRVPGRTDNQVKNHWNTHLCKKLGITKQQSGRKLRDRSLPSKSRPSSSSSSHTQMDQEIITHHNNNDVDITFSSMPIIDDDDHPKISQHKETHQEEVLSQGQAGSMMMSCLNYDNNNNNNENDDNNNDNYCVVPKANNNINDGSEEEQLHNNWPAGGIEMKDNFGDQPSSLFEFDDYYYHHNFVLHSPPGLMEFFDEFDVI